MPPASSRRVSLSNRLIVHVALPLRGGKRRLSSAERTSRRIDATSRRPRRHAPPRRLSRRVRVELERQEGWPIYDLAPQASSPGTALPDPGPALIYLHGGAYISEITRAHWSLAARLVRTVPCRCRLPIYPLGSRAGAARVVATAAEITARMIEEHGGEGVVLAGDSAGGGLALAVAQTLRDRDLAPARTILISPWLDVATDRPEQTALERHDAMLAVAGLREAGRAYACGLPLDDPRVSPVRGDLAGLPPITVFTGTRDLLNPDSHRLLAGCSAAATDCELIEAPGMPHGYPLMPTPEGRAARLRVAELLRRR